MNLNVAVNVDVSLSPVSSVELPSPQREAAARFLFDPESVTVPAGVTVVWRTEGFTPHTVTAYEDQIPRDAEYFASGDYESEQAARDGYVDGGGQVGRNEEYEHTFEVPGTYGYFCIPHESSMVGTVTVEEPA